MDAELVTKICAKNECPNSREICRVNVAGYGCRNYAVGGGGHSTDDAMD